MSCTLLISENPFEPEAVVRYDDVEDIRVVLMQHFREWPDTAHIFHNQVAETHDITPFDEASIDRLKGLDGTVYVVVYPEGMFWITIILVVALSAIAYLLKPKIPDINQGNREVPSPNNELSARSNRERLNARIPDIYGQIRCFPDLITPSYKVFENNREVEMAYMCVGQGEYLIEDVRDGDTFLSYMTGASAEFYGPDLSPNNGSPFLTTGAAIEEDIWRARRLPQVEGPELKPPDTASDVIAGLWDFSTYVSGVGYVPWSQAQKFYMKWPSEMGSKAGFTFDGTPNAAGISGEYGYEPDQTFSLTMQDKVVQSNDVVLNAVAKYNADGTVELVGEVPEYNFVVGDVVHVTNSSTNILKKPVTETATKTATYYRDGSDNYFIEFAGSEPVEDGDDFRTAKDFLLGEDTKIVLDFSDTYTLVAKTLTTLVVASPGADWAHLYGTSGWVTCIIGGVSRTVRFIKATNTIEVQTGNFNDIAFPGSVTLTGATETLNFNGTHQITAINAGTNRWQLLDPVSVSQTWERLVPSQSSKSLTITVSQLHDTDVVNENFNGSYTITALDGAVMTLDNPASVNAAWSRLPLYLQDTSGFGGNNDTFTVTAPLRTINLSGEYTFVSIDRYDTLLEAPQLANPDWYKLRFLPGQQATELIFTSLATTGRAEVGPFFISDPDTEAVYCNFYAANGLFNEKPSGNSTVQVSIFVDVEVTVESADTAGNPLGVIETFTVNLRGSTENKNAVGVTLRCNLNTTKGPVLVTARRLTNKYEGDGQFVQDVKWRDCYGMVKDTTPHYGHVTTVLTKTYATGNTLAVRERKFNCLVTRKIPLVVGFSGTFPNYSPVFDPNLQPTKDGAQIFCALSTSPVFGNRPASDLDYFQIFETRDQIVDYFQGDERSVEFCHTFDNTNVSYEEAAQAIANACFATAYRQGSKIRWKADIATQEPVMIFNHRNKIPDSETRTIRFDKQNDNDSIQLEWIDPVDDSVQTFYIPEDQSGAAPKKIETIGIRNRTQAVWHAYRAWYRLQYQNTIIEFDSTQEAGLLTAKDVALIADNTRADVQDGEVWGQEMLTLTLSQEFNYVAGRTYTIFLQHTDGTVESIPISPVQDILNVNKNVYMSNLGGFRFAVPADAGLFATGDTVTVANAVFQDPVNGSLNLNGTYTVLSINNVTGFVIFDNPAAVTDAWSDITVTEIGPRLNVNFQSERYAKRRVNLQHATRQALSLDPENYARATYVIRSNLERAPQLFQIQDATSRDGFKYSISAVNFDARYYYLDDIQFWLNFDNGITDSSSRNHSLSISTAAGKAKTGSAEGRSSPVLDNAANQSAAWIQSSTLVGSGGSYTKAVWVKQTTGFDAYFLSNAQEQFRCNTTGRIIAGHAPNLTTLTFAEFVSPLDEWQHIGVTYDADLLLLRIYYNGLLVAQKTGVAPATSAALQPVGNGASGVIAPYCDDVRMWFRAFTADQMLELYNSTKG